MLRSYTADRSLVVLQRDTRCGAVIVDKTSCAVKSVMRVSGDHGRRTRLVGLGTCALVKISCSAGVVSVGRRPRLWINLLGKTGQPVISISACIQAALSDRGDVIEQIVLV